MPERGADIELRADRQRGDVGRELRVALGAEAVQHHELARARDRHVRGAMRRRERRVDASPPRRRESRARTSMSTQSAIAAAHVGSISSICEDALELLDRRLVGGAVGILEVIQVEPALHVLEAPFDRASVVEWQRRQRLAPRPRRGGPSAIPAGPGAGNRRPRPRRRARPRRPGRARTGSRCAAGRGSRGRTRSRRASCRAPRSAPR